MNGKKAKKIRRNVRLLGIDPIKFKGLYKRYKKKYVISSLESSSEINHK